MSAAVGVGRVLVWEIGSGSLVVVSCKDCIGRFGGYTDYRAGYREPLGLRRRGIKLCWQVCRIPCVREVVQVITNFSNFEDGGKV